MLSWLLAILSALFTLDPFSVTFSLKHTQFTRARLRDRVCCSGIRFCTSIHALAVFRFMYNASQRLRREDEKVIDIPPLAL